MGKHIHFVISSESTKTNIDPSQKTALKHAQDAVAFAKGKSGEEISSVFASAVFSTDGFYLETKEVSALGDTTIGADKIKTIKDLDEVVNNWLTRPDDKLISGFAMAETIHKRISGSDIDSTIVNQDELSSVLDSVSSLAQRMIQFEMLGDRDWSVSAGDYLFGDQFAHFGVSWIDEDSVYFAMKASPNHRLWVTRLEVMTP